MIKDTFTEKLLRRLRDGWHLSALDCSMWQGNPSTKTTSRISDLRRRGWPIKDKWIKTENGKRYKIYYMKKGAKKK